MLSWWIILVRMCVDEWKDFFSCVFTYLFSYSLVSVIFFSHLTYSLFLIYLLVLLSFSLSICLSHRNRNKDLSPFLVNNFFSCCVTPWVVVLCVWRSGSRAVGWKLCTDSQSWDPAVPCCGHRVQSRIEGLTQDSYAKQCLFLVPLRSIVRVCSICLFSFFFFNYKKIP